MKSLASLLRLGIKLMRLTSEYMEHPYHAHWTPRVMLVLTGWFAGAVDQTPHLLLLDEIEKAHPDLIFYCRLWIMKLTIITARLLFP